MPQLGVSVVLNHLDIAGTERRLRESPDAGLCAPGQPPPMPLWILTIAMVGSIWVIGTILAAFGATWLVRHQPD